MADADLSNRRLGRLVETPVGGELVRAFVPPPLPPIPAIDVLTLLERLSMAERALGRLDAITTLLPRQELFLYMYVRKEAVLSSQIEGTQATLTDLLRFEADALAGQPIDDIREVSNYVDAINCLSRSVSSARCTLAFSRADGA
jgi:Fic family protein